jgi:hypothetical protein
MRARHVRSLLACVTGAVSLCCGLVAAPAAQGDLESATTIIAVKLDDRLSSQDNKAGDVFHFELTGSVIVDGKPLGAGTHGSGVVVAATPGEGPLHGALTVEARSLDLADGSHIPVGLAPGTLDKRLTRESRGLSVPMGHAAPVYIGTSRDNNVVYEKGTAFKVVAPPPATPDPDPFATST